MFHSAMLVYNNSVQNPGYVHYEVRQLLCGRDIMNVMSGPMLLVT